MSTSQPFNSSVNLEALFESQKSNLTIISPTDYKVRQNKLERLEDYILTHQSSIIQALYQDLRKPTQEAILSEIVPVISELRYTKKHVKRWMQPFKVPTTLSSLGTSSFIQYEAKGQVLLISPWNYPFCLVVKPLISAIAAGCSVIIKPSEFTPATNRILQELIQSLFNENEIALVNGDAEIAKQLLQLPFHHIFFTGSPSIGKIVMKAAAEHLTSVTLELGGKSPLLLDDTVQLEKVVDSIVWAKFLNNGQTCIAPDYVLIQQTHYKRLVTLLQERISLMYGETAEAISSSRDYGRIIHQKQFDRLLSLLTDATQKGATIHSGGESDREDLFIAPTLLIDVDTDMKVMQEEIFGPILPIIAYTTLEEAIAFIQGNPKPLALYLFSNSSEHIQEVLQKTTSGSVVVNDFLQQFANPELPFGGVNTSGIGKSNGYHGFQEFSNAKAVMHRRVGSLSPLFPPYKSHGLQKKLFDLLTRFC